MLTFVVVAAYLATEAGEPPENVTTWISKLQGSHKTQIAKTEEELNSAKQWRGSSKERKERTKKASEKLKSLKAGNLDPNSVNMSLKPTVGEVGYCTRGRVVKVIDGNSTAIQIETEGFDVDIVGGVQTQRPKTLRSSVVIIKGIDTSKLADDQAVSLNCLFEATGVDRSGGSSTVILEPFDSSRWDHLLKMSSKKK